ncbi:MAG: hypothetical protein FWC51_01080 [Proteobacteria bacterium]|nr:hypothetical protein [Pseudomonadota bacterium]
MDHQSLQESLADALVDIVRTEMAALENTFMDDFAAGEYDFNQIAELFLNPAASVKYPQDYGLSAEQSKEISDYFKSNAAKIRAFLYQQLYGILFEKDANDNEFVRQPVTQTMVNAANILIFVATHGYVEKKEDAAKIQYMMQEAINTEKTKAEIRKDFSGAAARLKILTESFQSPPVKKNFVKKLFSRPGNRKFESLAELLKEVEGKERLLDEEALNLIQNAAFLEDIGNRDAVMGFDNEDPNGSLQRFSKDYIQSMMGIANRTNIQTLQRAATGFSDLDAPHAFVLNFVLIPRMQKMVEMIKTIAQEPSIS